MSASSTPTLRPWSRRPSARLTAVVDLPTPPLPEATAMTASTPGMPGCVRSAGCAWPWPCPWVWGACPCGAAAGALRRQRHQRRRHARHGLDGVLGALAHRLPSLHVGRANGDREEHLVVADDDFGQDPRLGQAAAVRG